MESVEDQENNFNLISLEDENIFGEKIVTDSNRINSESIIVMGDVERFDREDQKIMDLQEIEVDDQSPGNNIAIAFDQKTQQQTLQIKNEPCKKRLIKASSESMLNL